MAVAFNSGNLSRSSSGTTVSISYTCSSGSDRLLLINSTEAGSTTLSGTYAGAALTSVGTSGPFKMWSKVAPATGANTLAFALSAYAANDINVSDWTGVDQTSPLGTPSASSGSSASPASASITVPTGGAAFGSTQGSYNSIAFPSASGSTTLVGSGRSGERPTAGGYITATGALDWTFPQATSWDTYAVPINPVSGGSAFLAKGLTPISQAIQGMY